MFYGNNPRSRGEPSSAVSALNDEGRGTHKGRQCLVLEVGRLGACHYSASRAGSIRWPVSIPDKSCIPTLRSVTRIAYEWHTATGNCIPWRQAEGVSGWRQVIQKDHGIS